MKVTKVPYHQVELPMFSMTPIDLQPDPSSYVRFKTRTVYLYPREIDGKVIMATYDRETDTLFVQEELNNV